MQGDIINNQVQYQLELNVVQLHREQTLFLLDIIQVIITKVQIVLQLVIKQVEIIRVNLV